MRALALALSALACACVSSDQELERAIARQAGLARPRGEPVGDTIRSDWPSATPGGAPRPRLRRRVLVLPDGSVLRHGEEAEWFESGVQKSERRYDHDRPSGVWRAWYEDGTPRSEVDHGDLVHPAPMRFWHRSGALAGEGQGIGGLKEGPWIHWSESGAPSAVGVYRAGLREGTWSFWEDEGCASVRRYASGRALP